MPSLHCWMSRVSRFARVRGFPSEFRIRHVRRLALMVATMIPRLRECATISGQFQARSLPCDLASTFDPEKIPDLRVAGEIRNRLIETG